VRAYDPAYAYETAVIIFDGLKRLYEDNETAMYYITLHNENYPMPEMPAGCAEGIIRGMYRVSTANVDGGPGTRQPAKPAAGSVQLFGSGAILREALRAQTLLADKYKISSDVWSVTSYTELRRDAQEAERWNMLHPEEPPRVPYVAEMLAGTEGPYVAASDHVRTLAEQVDPWIPGGLFALGTDGMGRSESRSALRRHFEVDAESITIAALYQLKKQGKCDGQCVAKAVKELGINPDKQSALYA
jgi:pyruvate dehydrogenase E1 component